MSNRNIVIIDLNQQVYSAQTKEDLEAKLNEFDVVEKETMTNERLKNMSKVDIEKERAKLVADRQSLMDIKFEYLSCGFHSGAITEIHTCL